MFDPYHKWLGIPPKDQPPDFYRLLSLQLFERDLEVIESAVDRTMGFVRQYQSGENAAHAAKLLNEIARARICLLKPATKSEYDAKLKSESSYARAAAAESDTYDFDRESVEFSTAPKRSSASRTKKSKRNSSSAQFWILGGVAGAIVVIAVLMVSKSGTSTLPPVAPTPPEFAEVKRPDVADTTHAKPPSAAAPSTPSSSMPPVAIASATKEKADSAGAQQAVVTARTPLAFEKPGFDIWVQSLTGLPAESQLEAVKMKLSELNPGFDGTLKRHLIQEGAVTEMEFSSDQITDISPVKALPRLDVLRCVGTYGTTGPQGKLTDLSPLTGMKLSRLACSASKQLDDLSPLKGMPLIELIFAGTSVSDLRPLRDMNRLHMVAFSSTPVSDLTPLIGLPIDTIHAANTLITDLSPVHGMELSVLNFVGANVTDLSPLQGQNLTHISFSPEKIVTGMEIVRAMTRLKSAYTRGAEIPIAEFWKRYDAGEFAAK